MCPKKGFDLDFREQEAIIDKSFYIFLLINVNFYRVVQKKFMVLSRVKVFEKL